ncbi:MAG TPA: CAP domain-containing protein [Pyrinomonadaceae bacterium]|jgi:uncharacterized protein YkwD|nr:CAP domain-containing protein [Pyrinomonadaceae bacterium]
MLRTKLNTFGARSLISQLNARAIASAALLLASFGAYQTTLAQDLQRPVARLIVSSVPDTGYSRPRRVSASGNASTAAKAATAAAPALEANTIELRAFEQTNVARAENGLPSLVWDAELCRMARAHSEQMALQGYFSHESPDGLHLKERAHESGILHFRVIGENIAYNKGYDDPGGFAVERWLSSSGHRANMLYAGFQASAIGSYVAADGSTYLTQVFIAR